MALLTQYASFFVSPFGEPTVCDELNLFLRSHRIVNVDKRLFDGERGTGWLFLVEYGTETRSATANQPRTDYREVLTEQEFALFEKLRDLRKTVAEKGSVPVYSVFTNDQLAAMVKKVPATLKEIAALPGVGEARTKQFGEQFVKFFAQHSPQVDEKSQPTS